MFVNSELFFSVLKSKYKSFVLSKPLSKIYQVAATDSLCCYLSKWSDFVISFMFACFKMISCPKARRKAQSKKRQFWIFLRKKNVWSLILAKCLGQRVWNSKITKKKKLFSTELKPILTPCENVPQVESTIWSTRDIFHFKIERRLNLTCFDSFCLFL
jgi:hypothetical protein